jgi:hypothetical protein
MQYQWILGLAMSSHSLASFPKVSIRSVKWQFKMRRQFSRFHEKMDMKIQIWTSAFWWSSREKPSVGMFSYKNPSWILCNARLFVVRPVH